MMKKLISRRNFLAVSGAAVAAAALTACGGSDTASSTTAAAGSAAAGDTIKVGVLGPMTGEVSVYGLAVDRKSVV